MIVLYFLYFLTLPHFIVQHCCYVRAMSKEVKISILKTEKVFCWQSMMITHNWFVFANWIYG